MFAACGGMLPARRTVRAMAIYALGEHVPQIHPDAFVHPDAVLIGDVQIGAESSVWPSAVLRGDGGGQIRVGARTSIQDGTVIHTTAEHPTIVGDDCTIGHLVHLEGCTIESGSLVGSGSIVLHRVIVRAGSIVGANSVLLNDTEVPAGALAVGSPAVIKEGKARGSEIANSSEHYVVKARQYRSGLRRID